MAIRNKEQFLTASSSKTTSVRIESLGEDVMIRSLYGYEQEKLADLRNRLGESPTNEELYGQLIVLTLAYGLVDESGARYFGDSPDDLEQIGRMAPVVKAEIAGKIARFSGLTPEAVDEAKNASSSDQSEGSTSA